MTRLFITLLLLLSPVISFADVMRVTILGSGTPRPDIERFSQAILIEAGDEKLLFDTGRGVTIRLSQMNFNVGDIDKVFFTHLHSDHTVGFPDLFMTGWIYQRNNSMRVFGPPGTKHYVEKIKEAFSEDIVIRTSKPESLNKKNLELNVFEIEEGIVYKNDNLSVKVFEVDHGGGVEHSFAYKINYKGKTVVISGDTNYSENLVNHSRGVDLLIHEIADAPQKLVTNNPKVQGLMNYHTTPDEMAKIINSTKPKLTILTHVLALGGTTHTSILNSVKSKLNKNYNVEMAYDLMAIDVKDKIRTYSIDYTYD
tara:strand:+ start:343 stop:1275 length:933 start_codon:yes stop_codon:yes gene_type:complete